MSYLCVVVLYLVEVTLDLLFLSFACKSLSLSNVLKESNLNVFDLLLDVMLFHCVYVSAG